MNKQKDEIPIHFEVGSGSIEIVTSKKETKIIPSTKGTMQSVITWNKCPETATPNIDCIVCMKDKTLMCAVHHRHKDDKTGYFYGTCGDMIFIDEIEYWAELPKPPEE